METPTPRILTNHKDEILECGMGIDIPLEITNWKNHLSEEPVLLELVSELRDNKDKISRHDIFPMVDEIEGCRNDDEAAYNHQLKKVFFAVMLWGYGTAMGFGPWRTNEMISSKRFPEAIRRSYEHMRNNEIEAAYSLLSKGTFKLPWLGPTFITKYLYFIGRKCDIMPIALDSNIANKLANVCSADKNIDISKYPIGKNNNVTTSSSRYMNYVTDMNSWAESLSVKTNRIVKPDQIEYFLFHYNG